MKRYHDSLRRVYAIITTEISNIDFEIALQMTFKVINDSIEFDDLIFTLLVFEVYFRMIEMNVSLLTIIQRVIAMRKTMKEVQKFITTRQMNDVLNTRNEFIITLIHKLLLNSSVLNFRENKENQSRSWKELLKLLSIQSESAIIELSNESIKFRTISLKSYYQKNDHTNDELSTSLIESSTESTIESSIESSIQSLIELIDESQSNPNYTDLISTDSIILTESVKRGRGRPRKYPASIANFVFNTIKSVVSSFIASRQKEIVNLLEKEIFISINKKNVSIDVRIFS
jgi:hypothetical protein